MKWNERAMKLSGRVKNREIYTWDPSLTLDQDKWLQLVSLSLVRGGN